MPIVTPETKAMRISIEWIPTKNKTDQTLRRQVDSVVDRRIVGIRYEPGNSPRHWQETVEWTRANRFDWVREDLDTDRDDLATREEEFTKTVQDKVIDQKMSEVKMTECRSEKSPHAIVSDHSVPGDH